MKGRHAATAHSLKADGRTYSENLSPADSRGSKQHGRPAVSVGSVHALCIGIIYSAMVTPHILRSVASCPRFGCMVVPVSGICDVEEPMLQFGLILWRIYWTPSALPLATPARQFSEARALQHVQKLAGDIGERQVPRRATTLRACPEHTICSEVLGFFFHRFRHPLWTQQLST